MYGAQNEAYHWGCARMIRKRRKMKRLRRNRENGDVKRNVTLRYFCVTSEGKNVSVEGAECYTGGHRCYVRGEIRRKRRIKGENRACEGVSGKGVAVAAPFVVNGRSGLCLSGELGYCS